MLFWCSVGAALVQRRRCFGAALVQRRLSATGLASFSSDGACFLELSGVYPFTQLSATGLAMKRCFPSSSDESDAGDPPRRDPSRPLHQALAASAGATSNAVMHQGSLHEPDASHAQSACRTGEKRPQAPHWADWLKEETAVKRTRLGKQKRKLVLHTSFSGQNSPEQTLRDLDVACDNTIAVERKAHARRFCSQNGLAPSQHYFTDFEPVASTGVGPCCKHNASCRLPPAKADLFVAGFPCTPFSQQRFGARDEASVREHPEFKKMSWTIDYIVRTKPRLFLLENVPSFAGKDSELKDVAVHSFYEELKEPLEEHGYSLDIAFLKLTPWVEASSTRLFIFGAERSLHCDNLCRDASRMAYQLEERRALCPPVPWRSCLLRFGSPEWLQAQACWLGPAQAVSHPSRLLDEENTEDVAKEGKWEAQGETYRKRWLRLGWSWHSAQPWAKPLAGMTPPDLVGVPKPVPARKQEVLDLGVLWAMEHRRLQELTASNVSMATEGLICNTTQNPNRGPWSFDLRRLCRNSRMYSYQDDRLLVPTELYKMYGWRSVDLSGLSLAHCQDMLGDSMALPTVGLALASLILTAGEAIPDLWE